MEGYIVKKGTVIGEALEIKPKTKTGILLQTEKNEMEYFEEHPFQVKVLMIGEDVEEHLPGIEVGDILYMDRSLMPGETVVINKKYYAKVNIGNVIVIKKKDIL